MNKNTVILPVVLILAAALVVVGFILLKNHKDKVAPTPVAVVEEPVVEEPEPVVEEPAPQPRRRQRRDINSSINTMNPMQGQNMPTREEAVNAARDILASYREASPQEKQQMAMGMNIVAGLMNGISQNAGQFVQQMSPEQRDRLVNSAGTSLELLSAVQEEMMNDITPEEAQVFGGVFQSMQNLNESLMNAALF